MNTLICLNSHYSTTRLVTKEIPNMTKDSMSKVQTQLFLPQNLHRKGEGGLRSEGYFKKSCVGKPLVTIITVALNGVNYIEKTMKSVINQTYDNVEYVVIDGGSTDGTLDIVKKYKDSITYWISEPDDGISDAFNKGISLSAGDIIGILSAGDWYETDTIAQVVSHFSTGKADIVHGMSQYWDSSAKKTHLICANHDLLHREMTVCHLTVFALRKCYTSIGLFRREFRYAMDYEWLLRAKVSGMTFLYINRCLAHSREGGISDRKWRSALWEVAQAKSIHFHGRINHLLYFVYQVIKGTVRRYLDHIGLQFITRFYHTRYSLTKKTRSID
ncbi:MAG: hypothetical protein BROFUL_03138 [Candidatus Brocadia fulgida]|uniref:Glycosyltransferase 2-like domain-containing protein n=1 Tax=Candidatus Brocadia fulgida TaxID=380242 RepID=A0A0M2URC7_9BACT|nr:MAG: hypothetical protein BROFUL_03138 [Candidatus Brocadia fulgida]